MARGQLELASIDDGNPEAAWNFNKMPPLNGFQGGPLESATSPL